MRFRTRPKLLLAGALVTASAFVGVTVSAQTWTNSDEGGVLIASVDPEGPASSAGIQRGDIIIEVDGDAVSGRVEFLAAISEKGSGDTLRITLTRGTARRTLTITVGKHEGSPYLGVLMAADGAAKRTFGDFRGGHPGAEGNRGGRGGFGPRGPQGRTALPAPEGTPSA